MSAESGLQSHSFLYGTEVYRLNTRAAVRGSFCWYLLQDENSMLNKPDVSLITQ